MTINDIDIARHIEDCEQHVLEDRGMICFDPYGGFYMGGACGAVLQVNFEEEVYYLNLGRWEKGEIVAGKWHEFTDGSEMFAALAEHFGGFAEKAKKHKKQQKEQNDCWKCDGSGYIPGYEHVDGGRCWACQ